MKALIYFILLFIVLLTGTLYAQNTDIKLSTVADTNSSFRVLNSDGSTRMRINSDGSFGLFRDTDTKLLWYPVKRAFRAGDAIGNLWFSWRCGNYSLATGYNTVAEADYSTAIGYNSVAHGTASIAIGYADSALGDYSTALGCDVDAIADYSTAMGYNTTASANLATAMGANTTASGTY